MDQHQAICMLKDLAIELGKTPTRREFLSAGKMSEHMLTKVFGTYSAMVIAAGLDANSKSKKIDNSVFERDIGRHLETYEDKDAPRLEPYPRMAIISDIHWPFHCQRVLDKFYRHIEKTQPDIVILNGDAWDMYSHTKFPRSHNVFTPRDEQALARKGNEEFWLEVQKAVKSAKCYQNLGNHDIRPLKRILEEYPEAEEWVAEKLRSLFSFQGVETNHDPRQELYFGNVIVHHGFKSQLGAHRDHNLQNTVSSHTHRPGVVFRTVRGVPIFELNTGYAGDPRAKGLTYTPTKITDWVQSFGEIDEDGPRVVIA